MKIIHEVVDNVHYMDIILYYEDIEKMQAHEMISAYLHDSQSPIYVGVRIKEGIEYEETIDW